MLYSFTGVVYTTNEDVDKKLCAAVETIQKKIQNEIQLKSKLILFLFLFSFFI